MLTNQSKKRLQIYSNLLKVIAHKIVPDKPIGHSRRHRPGRSVRRSKAVWTRRLRRSLSRRVLTRSASKRVARSQHESVNAVNRAYPLRTKPRHELNKQLQTA